MIGKHYRIKRQDGNFEEGITDKQGLTHVVKTFASEVLEIEVME